MGRKVSKKRVQISIARVVSAARHRDLRSAGLCRECVVILLQGAVQERLIEYGREHVGHGIGGRCLDHLRARRRAYRTRDPIFVFYSGNHMG